MEHKYTPGPWHVRTRPSPTAVWEGDDAPATIAADGGAE